ncbi:hypothetical protein WKI68_44480 [Streptomyces sp. MS1.HAVA.3]|uniref:MFS transporter n=1 Tax=Streptomyces caledonius TaxID=3134107 RepID=A0ABU8UEV6_9ACTN
MALYTALPLCVALGADLPLLLAGHVLGGGAIAFWSVMWATSVQTHTPPAVLNRVTAYELAGSVSGIALGQMLAGPATALASPDRLLLVSAGACLAGCAALFAIPAIRTLHRTAPTDSAKPGPWRPERRMSGPATHAPRPRRAADAPGAGGLLRSLGRVRPLAAARGRHNNGKGHPPRPLGTHLVTAPHTRAAARLSQVRCTVRAMAKRPTTNWREGIAEEAEALAAGALDPGCACMAALFPRRSWWRPITSSTPSRGVARVGWCRGCPGVRRRGARRPGPECRG